MVLSYLAHYKHTFSHMSFCTQVQQTVCKNCDFQSRIASNLAVLLSFTVPMKTTVQLPFIQYLLMLLKYWEEFR